MRSATECLSDTGPMCPDSEMCDSAGPPTCHQPTLFVAGSHAPTSPSLASVRDWLENKADFGLSFIAFCRSLGRSGWSSRMCPVCYPVADASLAERLIEYCASIGISDVNDRSLSRALSALPESECSSLIRAATLPLSFKGWRTSGMWGPGGFWTLKAGPLPRPAVACSLSDTLETEKDWLRRHPGETVRDWLRYIGKFFLGPTAARGILRRAAKRGRTLPPQLRRVLQTKSLDTGGLNPNCAQGGQLVWDEQQITSRDNRSHGRVESTYTLNQAGRMMVGVRRLTPTETLRLQGFPDDWLDDLNLSDTAKYRMTGNAVTVNVIGWLGRRIVEAEAAQ